MIIEERFSVSASRHAVAAFLTDIEELRACVPGVDSVEAVGDGRYHGVLQVSAGPIRARFRGEITLDRGGAPERISATAKARDGNTGSAVEVSLTAKLDEVADGTSVAASADVVLRGRLAQFGSGVMKAIAAEMVRDFAGRVNDRLASRGQPAEPALVGREVDPPHGDVGAVDVRPDAVVIASGSRDQSPRLSLSRMVWLALRAAWNGLRRWITRSRRLVKGGD